MDGSWALRPVRIRLRARRFYCRNELCERHVFTERFEQEIIPYARRFQRVNDILMALVFTTGGNPGSILSKLLGMSVSASTLLRLIARQPPQKIETPRVLGVDDWAFKKGKEYGTILVDLEKQIPIDLLPDRKAESLSDWLKKHSGVEIISRDRASCYSEGAKEGAPDAIQVADRWHLLKNLGDMLQRILNKHPKALRTATQAMFIEEKVEQKEKDKPLQTDDSSEDSPQPIDPIKTEAESRREMNFKQVKILQKEGVGIRAISRRVGLHRQTVKKYMALETLPPRAIPINRVAKTTPFLGYLATRWEEGETNLRTLFLEIKKKGYKGSYPGVVRAKKIFAGSDPSTTNSKKERPNFRSLSARRASIILSKDPEELSDKEKRFSESLLTNCQDIKTALPIAREFIQMVKEKTAQSLDPWLQKAIDSGIKRLEDFAKCIKSDYDAVHAALNLPWSNGQVEGQVNRLKNIKRQMYGRAGFELLRKRVLFRVRDG